MTGHAARRYRFPKRTFRNQDLGPFINHEMNRCITATAACASTRTTPAATTSTPSGGAQPRSTSAATKTACSRTSSAATWSRSAPPASSPTRRCKQHYTRKWDLTSAPSVCVHCGVGCNMLAGERYGGLRRILNRYHSRGERLLPLRPRPLRLRVREPPRAARSSRCCARARGELDDRHADRGARPLRRAARARAGCSASRSPRASLESSFALERVVGASAFCRGLADAEAALLERQAAILAAGPAASAIARGRARQRRRAGARRGPHRHRAGAGARAAAGGDGGADRRTCRATSRAGTTRRCASGSGTKRGPFFIASPLPTRARRRGDALGAARRRRAPPSSRWRCARALRCRRSGGARARLERLRLAASWRRRSRRRCAPPSAR